MEIQPITYQSHIVAALTRRRLLLPDETRARPAEDPVLTFVLAMALYACEIAHGLRPGPYRDADAIRHARRALIPAELLERPTLDIAAVARWLNIPGRELHAAQTEYQAELIADWLLPPT